MQIISISGKIEGESNQDASVCKNMHNIIHTKYHSLWSIKFILQEKLFKVWREHSLQINLLKDLQFTLGFTCIKVNHNKYINLHTYFHFQTFTTPSFEADSINGCVVWIVEMALIIS